MVFATVTMVLVLLAVLVMYSTGQLTTQRMKLQNTADAMAYSGAVTQARDLNFTAYMNRAMVANQVAVAQVVSITGWARNFDNTYNGEYAEIAETLADLSSLSAMWTVPTSIYKPIGETLKSIFDSVGPVMVKALDFLIDALSYSSQGYHYGMAVTLPQTVYDVMKENDPNASLTPFGIAGTGIGVVRHLIFAKRYDPAGSTDGDNRFANVVDASSDLFYKNRTLPLTFWPTPMLIDPTRLFEPGVGPLIMFNFHSGGSVNKTASNNSSQNLKSWGSIDATGTFVIFCLTINIFGVPVPIPFPLPPLPAGSGAAAAGTYDNSSILMPGNYLQHRNGANTGVDPAAAIDFGAAYINPYTAIPYIIRAGEGPGTNLDSRAGMRTYLDVSGNADKTESKQATGDVKDTKNNNQNTKAPWFFVEVQRESKSISTTNSNTFHLGGDDGQLSLADGAVGNKVRAMAKAEAYFSRPKALFPRGDGKVEYGSLYSPYWQAHLLPSGIVEQAASIVTPTVFPEL
jgi:hypothetical protein